MEINTHSFFYLKIGHFLKSDWLNALLVHIFFINCAVPQLLLWIDAIPYVYLFIRTALHINIFFSFTLFLHKLLCYHLTNKLPFCSIISIFPFFHAYSLCTCLYSEV